MKKLLVGILLLIGLSAFVMWYSDGTNPYGHYPFVSSPFTTFVDAQGNIQLKQQSPVILYNVPTWIALAIDQLQEFGRVVPNRFDPEKPFHGTVDQIIAQIHSVRFDPSKPYVISAGHFGELYVRNFGIFYSSMLDGRFALSQKDWTDRERVTLQTVALDLELLRQSGKEYTTFTPVSANGYVGTNIYKEPSDSLFAVMWTLRALTDDHFLSTVFPGGEAKYPLQTIPAGKKLVQSYQKPLTTATNQWLQRVIDPHTGLIRKDILLSSARDQIMRQSSFYDNVVAWSSVKMALDLGLPITCPQILQKNNSCDLVSWKQKIITTFWDEQAGIFLDDHSQESIQNHLYSGDAFVVTSAQFLDLSNEQERHMLESEIAYVQKNKLDSPFPLRYAIKDNPDKLYFFNRYFAPSYMGETIWSHWGMEYVKALLLLHQYDPSYVTIAQKDMDAYSANIVKYGGYPELYDKSGNIYQTSVYRSLLHTGWVVNFEQARMMLGSEGK